MRRTDGTFAPGVSGNPSGRPAVVTELQKLAREHTTAALQVLIDVMGNRGAAPAARVAAATALLDRGYGRPSTAVLIEAVSAPSVPSAEREALLATLADSMVSSARPDRS